MLAPITSSLLYMMKQVSPSTRKKLVESSNGKYGYIVEGAQYSIRLTSWLFLFLLFHS